MTGTLTRPAPEARRPKGARPPLPPPAAGRTPLGDWRADPTLVATIAITAMTMSVALGFGRLFADGSFLVPVVLTTLVAHSLAWWCRRHEVSTAGAAMITVGATGLVAAWTILGHTTAYGVPVPATLREAGAVLSAARDVFSVVKAPAAVLPGFVLATVLALGLAAFMADWAAFRIQATFEAIIPTFTLFLFTAALGTSRHRTWAVALFVTATLAYLVVAGLARSNRAGAWFGGKAAAGPGAMLRNATLLGAIALVVALVLGPRLPAPKEPVIKYKNRTASGPSNRATISPLVDIRGRLVNQTGLEVFTVRSDVKAYWRLTSLDDFDGNTWTSTDTYRSIRRDLRTDEILVPGVPSSPTTQEFAINTLASIWLPAAFRPTEVDEIKDVSFNPDSASLITPEDTTDGLTYKVESNVPQLTPELLNGAPARAPKDVAARYLSLPPIAPAVVAEARRIVAPGRTPYEKARLLQDHFHTGKFRYDLNARPGHDTRALENFLLRTKAGYCEQYAGTYAVLARIVGLPSRIAVGFTPGNLVNGVYRVTDENAHAWPEVYLEGFGWVAFEPTPGRGAPNATAYTGRPEAQEQTSAGALDDTTATSGVPAEGDLAPTSIPEFSGENGALPAPKDAPRPIPGVVKLLLVLTSVAALWAAVVPSLHARRRRARRALGGSAAAVLAEWADTSEVLAAAGVGRRATETMTEYAARAANSAGLQADPARALRRLAADASMAAYTDGDIPAALVERAAALGSTVRAAVFDQVSFAARMGWWLDPRTLVGSRSS